MYTCTKSSKHPTAQTAKRPKRGVLFGLVTVIIKNPKTAKRKLRGSGVRLSPRQGVTRGGQRPPEKQAGKRINACRPPRTFTPRRSRQSIHRYYTKISPPPPPPPPPKSRKKTPPDTIQKSPPPPPLPLPAKGSKKAPRGELFCIIFSETSQSCLCRL